MKPLVRIEILRIENFYLSESGIREARVLWKTSEATLYQIRRGYNCHTGDPLDKINYSGITAAGKENTLRIAAAMLKPGLNNLVICVNRAPLTAASSQELDYGADVYEKNLSLILDDTAPVTVARLEDSAAKSRTLQLRCYDDGACETLFYSLHGNGRTENFQQKNNSATITLQENQDWVESIRYYSADRAGNREAPQEFKINAERFGWFGNGRVAVTPALLFRTGDAGLRPATGWSIGINADLPIAQLASLRQTAYVPALRIEGGVISFQGNANTQDNAGYFGAGAAWLYPLKKGILGALSGGITAGLARYFSIVSARDVTTMLAFYINTFAGYEYTFRNIYFFAHWRLTHIATTDALWGHGPAAGAGIIF